MSFRTEKKLVQASKKIDKSIKKIASVLAIVFDLRMTKSNKEEATYPGFTHYFYFLRASPCVSSIDHKDQGVYPISLELRESLKDKSTSGSLRTRGTFLKVHKGLTYSVLHSLTKHFLLLVKARPIDLLYMP